MSDCCDPSPYRHFFNRKEARRKIRQYRRKGLDQMATSMVDFLVSEGVDGANMLEVGGGIGAIEIELLKKGVSSAVNVELSAGYDEAADELAAKEGVAGQIERKIGDFVELQDEIDPADIVVLNKVVCCYPLMKRMMGAATSKTGKYLAVVFPREKWWNKLMFGLGDRFLKLRGCAFQSFVHPVDEIERVASGAGLVVRHRDNTTVWQAVVWERAA